MLLRLTSTALSLSILLSVAAQTSDEDAMLDELFLATLTDGGVELSPVDEVPVRYRIAVALDTDFWIYTALQRVTYTNNEDVTLRRIVFHVFPNARFMRVGDRPNILIQSVLVDGQEVSTGERGTVVTVPLAEPLRPGDSTTIEMRFKGRLPPTDDGTDMNKLAMDQLMGMLLGSHEHDEGLGNFGIFGTTGRVGSMALWHPLVAAFDERGWDEGSPEEMGDFSYFDASDLQVTIRAPQSARIIGGGVITGERLEGEHQLVTFTAGRARELTMQVSEDYRSASGDVDGIRVNAWYLKEHSGTGMDVLGWAMKAVRIYNREFGPYPYAELDVVEAPLLNGVAGVEFPGLCTIASMFYVNDNPEADPFAQMMGMPYMKDTLEFVVAHEVAHQWWNATVGSDSRGHPFIDEALANYASILYFEKAYGPEKANRVIETQIKLNWHMSRMMGNPDMPVDLPSSEFTDAVSYVATIYGKGALYYLALRDLVGEEAFSIAIQNYYRDHYMRIAGPDGLPMAVKMAAPQHAGQIDALTERWLHGSHGDEDIGALSFTDGLTIFLEMMDPGEGQASELMRGLEGGLQLMDALEELGALEYLQELFGEGW